MHGGERETSKTVHIFVCILRLPFWFILLQSYQEHCSEGSSLSSTVSLLEHTSEIVSFFNDKLCITSCQDKRLQPLILKYRTWIGASIPSENEANFENWPPF